MRLVVIGGHGRTGILIVEKAISEKHEVVATIRNSKHMVDLVKLGAETWLIDLETSALDEIAKAMKDADAVVFAAGSAEGETSELDRKGTLRTVRAAEKAGVGRYISVSALGASTGMSTRSMSNEMKDYYRQKRSAAKHIASSNLSWTIVEPAELTDGKASGKVSASLGALDGKPIDREDVASVVVALLEEPKSAGRAIQLSGGTTSIKAALAEALA